VPVLYFLTSGIPSMSSIDGRFAGSPYCRQALIKKCRKKEKGHKAHKSGYLQHPLDQPCKNGWPRDGCARKLGDALRAEVERKTHQARPLDEGGREGGRERGREGTQ